LDIGVRDIRFVPGADGGVPGVVYDMDILGWHITLDQQVDPSAFGIFGNVCYEHGMSGGTSFDQHFPGRDGTIVGYRQELFLQGPGAAISEDGGKVAAKGAEPPRF
jgi:hypothetical protein